MKSKKNRINLKLEMDVNLQEKRLLFLRICLSQLRLLINTKETIFKYSSIGLSNTFQEIKSIYQKGLT